VTRALHAFILATCVGLFVIVSAIYVRQSDEQARSADAVQRISALEQRVSSLATALGALAVGSRANGEADARLYTDVQALALEVKQNAARDRYRFTLTTSALGAGH
jgi:putative Mn2+ efflux pump MntP